MSLLKMPSIFSKSPVTPLEDGLMKIKLKLLKLKEDIEGILSSSLTNYKTKKIKRVKKLYMQEFPLKNKNQISIDKSFISPINIQTIKLSQISQVESISSVQVLTPFWTEFSTAISKKLLSSHMIDSFDLDSNFSKISVANLIPNSSLTVIQQNINLHQKNLPKTSYQSLQFLQPNITEVENIKTVKIARRIRIFPSKKLKKYLNNCFGTYRFFYNKGVEYIKTNDENKKKLISDRIKENKCCVRKDEKFTCSKPIDKYDDLHLNCTCTKHKNIKVPLYNYYDISLLRNNLIPKTSDIKGAISWQSNFPYDLKQNSLRDLLSNLKSAISNKINNDRKYNMGYKTKKK